MRDDAWPRYCRTLLVAFVASGRASSRAAANWRRSACKTLKEARAIARLFLPSLGEPARVTIAALAIVRRRRPCA